MPYLFHMTYCILLCLSVSATENPIDDLFASLMDEGVQQDVSQGNSKCEDASDYQKILQDKGAIHYLWSTPVLQGEIYVKENPVIRSNINKCRNCSSDSDGVCNENLNTINAEGCIVNDLLKSFSLLEMKQNIIDTICTLWTPLNSARCSRQASVISGQLRVDRFGHALLSRQKGAFNAENMVMVTAWLGLDMSESSINTNFLHLQDPRISSSILPLPRYFAHGIPLMRELKHNWIVITPSFVRTSIFGHGDEDECRSYFVADVAVPKHQDFDHKRAATQNGKVLMNVNENHHWPTPVLIIPTAVGKDSTLRNVLLRAFLEAESTNRTVYKSNKGGFQSSSDLFDHIWSIPELADLKELVYAGISKYVQDATHGSVLRSEAAGSIVEIDVYEAWFGINRGGHSNAGHIHPGGHLSGSLYLSLPSKENNSTVRGGRIILHDPRGPISEEFGSEFSFQPDVGDLVIFPSWLEHHVEPVVSQPTNHVEPRVIVSFNAKVTQREGFARRSRPIVYKCNLQQ